MLLLIQKSSSNKLVVTLNELVNIANDLNFLFVFTLDQDNYYTYKSYLTATASTVRYNAFTLLEGTDITFKFLGDYRYDVYQMPDGGSTDESDGVIIETGKAKVVETVAATPTYSVVNTTQIYDQAVI